MLLRTTYTASASAAVARRNSSRPLAYVDVVHVCVCSYRGNGERDLRRFPHTRARPMALGGVGGSSAGRLPAFRRAPWQRAMAARRTVCPGRRSRERSRTGRRAQVRLQKEQQQQQQLRQRRERSTSYFVFFFFDAIHKDALSPLFYKE